MHNYKTHFFLAFSLVALLMSGCGRLGGNIDTCSLVSKSDAESILLKPAHLDKEATAELDRLSSSAPGVSGTCVYTSDGAANPSRIVVGYRNYESAELIKSAFEDSRSNVWKSKAQQTVDGVGDEAVLLDGHLVALRKGKTWLQLGIEQPEGSEFSVEALKSVAKHAGSSL